MRKILMMAAYILLTLQCVGVYAGGKLPLEYGTKNLVVPCAIFCLYGYQWFFYVPRIFG